MNKLSEINYYNFKIIFNEINSFYNINIKLNTNTNENGYWSYLEFKNDTVYLELGAKKEYFIEHIDNYAKIIIKTKHPFRVKK